MSYYTKHEVSWDRTEVTEEEVSRALAEIAADDGSVRTPESRSGQDPAGRWLEIITGEERAEWAQVDTHMRELSTRYPGVGFTVDGQGEEQGDAWRESFQDGGSRLVHMKDFELNPAGPEPGEPAPEGTEGRTTLHAVLDGGPRPKIVCRRRELEKAMGERKPEGRFATPDGSHAVAPGDSAVNCPECLRKTSMMRKTNTGWSQIEMPGAARMDANDLYDWHRKVIAFLDDMEARTRELGLREAETLARASAALRGR